MVVVNETDVNLSIRGKTVSSGESQNFIESGFNELHIHSDIGSSEVITEYTTRCITNYGKLVVEEEERKDENGMNYIIVRSK